MNTKLKKALYESIMKSVAKTVKKSLIESYSCQVEDSYTMTVTGTYALVICDPCYALKTDVYENEWGPHYDNGIIGDNIGLVHGTAYGDGDYDSQSGRKYGVDAGCLGIYDINYCKKHLTNDSIKIITVDEDEEHLVQLEYADGTFSFYIDNNLVEEIYTNEEDDEDDDYYYDEDDI